MHLNASLDDSLSPRWINAIDYERTICVLFSSLIGWNFSSRSLCSLNSRISLTHCILFSSTVSHASALTRLCLSVSLCVPDSTTVFLRFSDTYRSYKYESIIWSQISLETLWTCPTWSNECPVCLFLLHLCIIFTSQHLTFSLLSHSLTNRCQAVTDCAFRFFPFSFSLDFLCLCFHSLQLSLSSSILLHKWTTETTTFMQDRSCWWWLSSLLGDCSFRLSVSLSLSLSCTMTKLFTWSSLLVANCSICGSRENIFSFSCLSLSSRHSLAQGEKKKERAGDVTCKWIAVE